LFYAVLPFALLAYPVSWLLDKALDLASKLEWRLNRLSPNGSEMYIMFRHEKQ
jgi:hypothetical protein